jgi:hypothetical protein
MRIAGTFADDVIEAIVRSAERHPSTPLHRSEQPLSSHHLQQISG